MAVTEGMETEMEMAEEASMDLLAKCKPLWPVGKYFFVRHLSIERFYSKYFVFIEMCFFYLFIYS